MVYKRYVYLETKTTQSSKTKILKALPYRTRRNRIVNIDNDTTIIYELKYYVESSNKNEFLNDLKRITEITNLSIEFNLDNKCYLLVIVPDSKIGNYCSFTNELFEYNFISDFDSTFLYEENTNLSYILNTQKNTNVSN